MPPLRPRLVWRGAPSCTPARNNNDPSLSPAPLCDAQGYDCCVGVRAGAPGDARCNHTGRVVTADCDADDRSLKLRFFEIGGCYEAT